MKRWICLLSALLLALAAPALGECEHDWQWVLDESKPETHIQQCRLCAEFGKSGNHKFDVDGISYPASIQLTDGLPPETIQMVIPSGKITNTCEYCGASEQKTAAELNCETAGRTDYRAPSCTEEGFARYELRLQFSKYGGASVGMSRSYTLSKLPHSFIHYNYNEDATCTADGTKTAKCEHCDAEDTVTASNTALGHTEIAAVTAPTCTGGGFTDYTCSVCGETRRADRTRALGHWYGEWQPNGDGTHSAICQRSGCEGTRTTNCEIAEFAPNAESAIKICPVCGLADDSARLTAPESARAEAIDGRLPLGEVVVRAGELANGERVLTVAFEYAGECTQPTGRAKILIPESLLGGAHPMDGEIEIPMKTDGENVSFELDFANETWKILRLI